MTIRYHSDRRAANDASRTAFEIPKRGGPLHHSATDPSCRKTRAIGFEPPKGYLLSDSSVRSNPSPGFSGNGYLPFTIRIAGNPNHSAQILSRGCGTTFPQHSCTRKFGMAESRWTEASNPIGPSHPWGAIEMPEAAAAIAVFHSAV